MQSNKMMTIVMVVALTVLLTAGSTAARVPGGEEKPLGDVRLAGTVASKISYQGRLTDAGGDPLDGTYNLVFQLWDDPSAGSQQGVDIPKNNVTVTNGLFTVELDVPQAAFNGQGLWLQISVNGQPLSPRQALLPVPYALSLKPGAVIESSSGDAALYGENSAGGYGISAYSQGNIGLVAQSGSFKIIPPPSGMIGVYAAGSGQGMSGHGGHTGVHGVGTSDGIKGESSAGNGVHGISSSGVAVYSEGDLYVSGAFRGDLGGGGGAPFPRPAYDSGWQSIAQDEDKVFAHNLGGDPDSYVVDVQFKGWALGIHRLGYGGQITYDSSKFTHTFEGAYWHNLSDQSIVVYREGNESNISEVRVRIWVVE